LKGGRSQTRETKIVSVDAELITLQISHCIQSDIVIIYYIFTVLKKFCNKSLKC